MNAANISEHELTMCVTPQPYRLPRRLPTTAATPIYTPRNRTVPMASMGLPIRYRQNVVVEPGLGAMRPPMPRITLGK